MFDKHFSKSHLRSFFRCLYAEALSSLGVLGRFLDANTRLKQIFVSGGVSAWLQDGAKERTANTPDSPARALNPFQEQTVAPIFVLDLIMGSQASFSGESSVALLSPNLSCGALQSVMSDVVNSTGSRVTEAMSFWPG